MKIYISGAISSDPDFRGKFNKAAKIIADNLECEVVNPVDISEYLDKEFKAEYAGSLPYNTYLKADIMQLLFCDGICLLEDWQTSKGAKLEREIAKALNMDIYHYSANGPVITREND